MAPERAAHVSAKAKAWRSLSAAIERANAPCEAFVDGLGVQIDDQTVYLPDALVNCGEPVPSDSLLAPTPTIVVEVLSPSSRGVDTNIKLVGYFRLASVQHYLIVDLQRELVLHYGRQGDQIALALRKDGVIALDPPGLSIDIADIFG